MFTELEKTVEKLFETINKEIGNIKKNQSGVAQSVKQLTLDFTSGHDLTVMRLSPLWALH